MGVVCEHIICTSFLPDHQISCLWFINQLAPYQVGADRNTIFGASKME